MQIKTLFVSLVAGSLIFASCNTFKSSKIELKTQADSVAYAIGSDMATTVTEKLPGAPGGKKISQQIILQAFSEIIKGEKSRLTPEQIPALTQSFFMKEQAAEGMASLEAGKKFLDENAKKSGIKRTDTGLQYEIIKEGSGLKPSATDTVVVNYKGTTIDGKQFESTEGKDPATFVVNQVIPAWTEVLQMMTEGSKYKIYSPSGLAYGERGMGMDIKPNTVLIFEIELIKVKQKK